MKNLIFFIVLILVSGFLTNQDAEAQRLLGRRGPVFTIELKLNGSYAMNDAFGETIDIPSNPLQQRDYGMKWGKGFSIESTYGFGTRRSNRISLGLEFNNMVNGANESQVPFFLFSPDTPKTVYNIYTASLGYQYLFGADCLNKQTIGFAITGSMISTPGEGSAIMFDNTFRLGFQISTGYEIVLDRNHNWGLALGFKYHLMNFFNSSNGNFTLNDGEDPAYGPGFKRFIGFVGINLGLKLYTGMKKKR